MKLSLALNLHAIGDFLGSVFQEFLPYFSPSNRGKKSFLHALTTPTKHRCLTENLLHESGSLPPPPHSRETIFASTRELHSLLYP